MHFVVSSSKLAGVSSQDELVKRFKLQSSLPATNFVLFSADGRITKYEDELQILKDFFKHRSDLYTRRKQFMLCSLQRDYELLLNKVNFIRAIIADTLKVTRVKKQVIVANMHKLGLKPLAQINAILKGFKTESEPVQEENDSESTCGKDFDYLLSMPLVSLSEERVTDLERQMQQKKTERDLLESSSHFSLWETDLQAFLTALDKAESKEEADRLATRGAKQAKSGKGKVPTIPKVGVKRSKAEITLFAELTKMADDDEDYEQEVSRKRKRVVI